MCYSNLSTFCHKFIRLNSRFLLIPITNVNIYVIFFVYFSILFIHQTDSIRDSITLTTNESKCVSNAFYYIYLEDNTNSTERTWYFDKMSRQVIIFASQRLQMDLMIL